MAGRHVRHLVAPADRAVGPRSRWQPLPHRQVVPQWPIRCDRGAYGLVRWARLPRRIPQRPSDRPRQQRDAGTVHRLDRRRQPRAHRGAPGTGAVHLAGYALPTSTPPRSGLALGRDSSNRRGGRIDGRRQPLAIPVHVEVSTRMFRARNVRGTPGVDLGHRPFHVGAPRCPLVPGGRSRRERCRHGSDARPMVT